MKEFHYTNTSLLQNNYNSLLFDDLLAHEWRNAMLKEVFKFKLGEKLPSKHLPGKFKFFIQVDKKNSFYQL